MSSFESFVCFEKYGLSGWVTWTSRPSIENSSLPSSFPTKNRLNQFRALQHADIRLREQQPCGEALAAEWRRLVCGNHRRPALGFVGAHLAGHRSYTI